METATCACRTAAGGHRCWHMSMQHPSLFEPLQVGSLHLPNRVVLSPLTRCRASAGRVPNVLMQEYYCQRASAGLLITEATAVDPMGVGYPDTPGIWSEAQVEGWRKITDAVHAKGGRIVCQLWHVGRISHPMYLDGAAPVAPSAIAAEGHVSGVRPLTSFPVPRALEISEIPGIVEQYRRGAHLAKEAGFDGIEIHGANGYLIDQFLHEKSNQRTDAYGGSIENRSRFLLEVTDACVSVWGADRVGMHLAPRADAHDVGGGNLEQLFTHVVRELAQRRIAFVCAREPYDATAIGPKLKESFGGVYIANQGFTGASANEAIAQGKADAVAFGNLYIANPDLPERLQAGWPLNEPDPDTYYGGDEHGYTDYPVYRA